MTSTRLREAAVRYDLLRHSFYTRWVAGELGLDELRAYAGEYRHVVAAMPRWLDQMADATPAEGHRLHGHAREERTHLSLWDDFAETLGCERAALADAVPNRATAQLLADGDRLVADGDGLEVLWALESQAPAVSTSKLAGLADHYAIAAGPGTRYFEVHTHMDVRHTAELEALMDQRPEPCRGHGAEVILADMYGLLGSVEREVATA